MADYSLTAGDGVFRNDDGMFIPDDPRNPDWVEYQAWLDDGGVPDPYVPPEPSPPEPMPEDYVLYDHENRLRALEGQPPLELGDFLVKMRSSRR